jgi:hypothetical protein
MRAFLLSLSVKYQMLFTVGITITAAFVIATLGSLFFDTHQLIANTDLISSIYQVMGTIYAILLTFTLWGTWQNFTAAEDSVEKETYALLDLIHMLEASPSWKQLNIRGLGLSYLKNVIEQEWDHLKCINNASISAYGNTHAAALEMFQAVQNLTPQSDREAVIFDHCLTLLDKWLDARRTRLLIARGNSAKALWPLLFSGSFMLFLCHGLFVAKTLGLWATLLFGVALVIGLTFYLIFTLDCPFAGSPSIDAEPFSLAINLLMGNNDKNSIEKG